MWFWGVLWYSVILLWHGIEWLCCSWFRKASWTPVCWPGVRAASPWRRGCTWASVCGSLTTTSSHTPAWGAVSIAGSGGAGRGGAGWGGSGRAGAVWARPGMGWGLGLGWAGLGSMKGCWQPCPIYKDHGRHGLGTHLWPHWNWKYHEYLWRYHKSIISNNTSIVNVLTWNLFTVSLMQMDRLHLITALIYAVCISIISILVNHDYTTIITNIYLYPFQVANEVVAALNWWHISSLLRHFLSRVYISPSFPNCHESTSDWSKWTAAITPSIH